MYYTYIIWSKNYDIFYKGVTQNPEHRLEEHNNNLGRFTAGKGPWALVYLKQHTTKKDELMEEKRINKLNASYRLQQLSSPDNQAPKLG